MGTLNATQQNILNKPSALSPVNQMNATGTFNGTATDMSHIDHEKAMDEYIRSQMPAARWTTPQHQGDADFFTK
jgi:hypothetical protein